MANDVKKRNAQRRLLAISGLIAFAGGCVQSSSQDLPAFVNELIDQMETDPLANPPASIWRFQYQGRTVYYVPPSCCDVPSSLYDTDGRLVCGPDGGLTGDGDGKCPDFFIKRSDERLLWRDPRGL
jgi:hypothetical protein